MLYSFPTGFPDLCEMGPNRSHLAELLSACEQFSHQNQVKLRFRRFLSGWHANSIDVSMKKQLRYRSLTIAIGIVVALLIVLTLWTKTEVPSNPKARSGAEITFALEPVIRAFSPAVIH